MKRMPQDKIKGPIVSLLFLFLLIFLLEAFSCLIVFPKDRIDRILSIIEQDADLFWRQKANLNTIFENAKLKTNQHGMRNKQIKAKKAPQTFRIICMGASPTLGWGVEEEKIYSAQLEKALNREFAEERSFEVINAAVIGYSSYQGLRLLERDLLKLDPDLLIVPYVINDVDKHRFFRSNTDSDKALRPKDRMLVNIENVLHKSRFVFLLKKFIKKLRYNIARNDEEKEISKFIERRRVSIEDYRKNLMRFIDIGRRNDIKIIFLKMPVNLPRKALPSEDNKLSAENHIQAALDLEKSRKYHKAIDGLLDALNDDPYSSEVHYYLSRLYERINKFDIADQYIDKTVKMELFECGRLGSLYNQVMSDVAREEGVTLIDIASEFHEFSKNNASYLFIDPEHDTIHPNGLGHSIISKAIFRSLSENSVID